MNHPFTKWMMNSLGYLKKKIREISTICLSFYTVILIGMKYYCHKSKKCVCTAPRLNHLLYTVVWHTGSVCDRDKAVTLNDSDTGLSFICRTYLGYILIILMTYNTMLPNVQHIEKFHS